MMIVDEADAFDSDTSEQDDMVFALEASKDAMIRAYQNRKLRVAIQAVEPSSFAGPAVLPRPTVYFNKPYFSISGVTVANIGADTSKNMTLQEEMSLMAGHVLSALADCNMKAEDIVQIHVYVADMSQFATLNAVYKGFFGHMNPPTRVTVSTELDGAQVLIDCVAVSREYEAIERDTMHVQSISYWAPYSQAVRIADHVYLAGQIGLIPHTMLLPKADKLLKNDRMLTDMVHECAVSLRSLSAVTSAMAAPLVENSLACVCYVSDINLASAAQSAWKSHFQTFAVPPTTFVVVKSLPRLARVEWEAIVGHPSGIERLQQIVDEADEQGQVQISSSSRVLRSKSVIRGDPSNGSHNATCSAELKWMGMSGVAVARAGFDDDIDKLTYTALASLSRGMMETINNVLKQLETVGESNPWRNVYSIRVFHVSVIPTAWIESAMHAALDVYAIKSGRIRPALTTIAVQAIIDGDAISCIAYTSTLPWIANAK
eukprot:jgi/Hompol1/2947/HPOL_003072-RA